LLETGNWTDSGHPTGRRVTFTNSSPSRPLLQFFDFGPVAFGSTDTGRGRKPNPYPIVEAVQKTLLEATAESAGQAEKEWQHAARSRNMSALSAAPASM